MGRSLWLELINPYLWLRDANSEATYEKMSAMKQPGCGLAISAVRENALRVNNVHIISDNMAGPNSSLFPWLV